MSSDQETLEGKSRKTSRFSCTFTIYRDFGVDMLPPSIGRRGWGAFVRCPRIPYSQDSRELPRELGTLWKEVCFLKPFRCATRNPRCCLHATVTRL